MHQAIKSVKSDFKDYLQYWTSKGASSELFQTLLLCAKAGVRPTYIDLLLDNHEKIKTNLAFNCEILSMRDSEVNEKTKQEDLALLVRFIDSGCTNDQIKAMFEFVTNKATNKELQQYYNNNQEYLKNNPKALASLTTTYPQIQSFLSSYNCSQSSKEHIRVMLVSAGKTNLSQLDTTQARTLRDQIKPKCKNGHVINSVGGTKYDCDSNRSGSQCLGK